MEDGPAINEDELSRIGVEVDMRLTDVWAMVFERGIENLDEDFLAWLMRLAYVTGYWDSLSEAERGALCTSLGYPVPPASGSSAVAGSGIVSGPSQDGTGPVHAPPSRVQRAPAPAGVDEQPRRGVIRASVTRHAFRQQH